MEALGGGLGGFWNPNLPFRKRPKKRGSKSSDSAETTSRPGYRFPLKQAATAGSLALTGDTIAQLRDRWTKRKPLDSDSNAFTKVGENKTVHFFFPLCVCSLMLWLVAEKMRGEKEVYSLKLSRVVFLFSSVWLIVNESVYLTVWLIRKMCI